MSSPQLTAVAPAVAAAIPKVLHRIWLGDRPLPAEAAAFGETWQALHPDWELRLWTDADVPPLRNQALFDAATIPAQRADILRYELIATHGGVYADTDVEFQRALDPLLEGRTAFLAAEDEQYVANGIFGAVPGHPFFAAVVDGLEAHVAAHPNTGVNVQTGPVMLTQALHAAQAAGTDVPDVFAPALFHPYRHDEPHRRHEAFPDAVAVHHWAKSWLPAPAAPPVDARFGVRLDWHTPVSMVAVARAYATTFEPADPVELAFVVAGELTAAHGEQVQTLMDSVADAPGAYAAVAVYGADELDAIRLDAAVTRPASEVQAGIELAETLAHMRRIQATLHPAPAAPAPAAPAAPAGGGVHGTYVGNNRMLVATTWGATLYVPADDHSLTPELIAHGGYDAPFTNYLLRHVRAGAVVFDVGANVGLFTVLMARAVGDGGHVVAYEAVPANAALVRENLATNWVADRATVLELAAAADAGTATFSVVPGFAGNGTLLDATDRSPLDAPTSFDVATAPLDEQLARFDRVDLVKIDVEGAELGVLRGMRRALADGTVRAIALEFRRDTTTADDWAQLTQVVRDLAADGWSVATLGEDGTPQPAPVEAAIAHGHLPQLLLQR